MCAGAVENVQRAHRITRDGHKRQLLVTHVEHRKDIRIRLVCVSIDAVGILLDLLVHAHEQDRDNVGIVAVELPVVAHRARAKRLHIIAGNVHPVVVRQRIAADRRQDQHRGDQDQRNGKQNTHDDDQHARSAAHAFFLRLRRRVFSGV